MAFGTFLWNAAPTSTKSQPRKAHRSRVGGGEEESSRGGTHQAWRHAAQRPETRFPNHRVKGSSCAESKSIWFRRARPGKEVSLDGCPFRFLKRPLPAIFTRFAGWTRESRRLDEGAQVTKPVPNSKNKGETRNRIANKERGEKEEEERATPARVLAITRRGGGERGRRRGGEEKRGAQDFPAWAQQKRCRQMEQW